MEPSRRSLSGCPRKQSLALTTTRSIAVKPRSGTTFGRPVFRAFSSDAPRCRQLVSFRPGKIHHQSARAGLAKMSEIGRAKRGYNHETKVAASATTFSWVPCGLPSGLCGLGASHAYLCVRRAGHSAGHAGRGAGPLFPWLPHPSGLP